MAQYNGYEFRLQNQTALIKAQLIYLLFDFSQVT